MAEMRSSIGWSPNWFTAMIDGHSERERPREEYMDEINGGRRYVVVKRLSYTLNVYRTEEIATLQLEKKMITHFYFDKIFKLRLL